VQADAENMLNMLRTCQLMLGADDARWSREEIIKWIRPPMQPNIPFIMCHVNLMSFPVLQGSDEFLLGFLPHSLILFFF
jgi:hypothetical protein